jgi:hypothetical protein
VRCRPPPPTTMLTIMLKAISQDLVTMMVSNLNCHVPIHKLFLKSSLVHIPRNLNIP